MRLRADISITCPINYVIPWYSFLFKYLESVQISSTRREKAEDYDHVG